MTLLNYNLPSIDKNLFTNYYSVKALINHVLVGSFCPV